MLRQRWSWLWLCGFWEFERRCQVSCRNGLSWSRQYRSKLEDVMIRVVSNRGCAKQVEEVEVERMTGRELSSVIRVSLQQLTVLPWYLGQKAQLPSTWLLDKKRATTGN